MNLALFVAKRYLFSKQRHQVINIISAVAVAGVALATAAMICTLSVFNGFQSVVEGQFTAMDPDIKVVTAVGKSFNTATSAMDSVKSLPGLLKVLMKIFSNSPILKNHSMAEEILCSRMNSTIMSYLVPNFSTR